MASSTIADFKTYINNGYQFKGPSIAIGSAIFEGNAVPGAFVNIPLKTMSRHGLIAGATGTGKTKTLQMLAENLADQGVPVLVMDVKGDLSGIATPGAVNDLISDRHERIGLPFEVLENSSEFLTISQEKGVRLRSTVSEFGPVLFSKILGLNDTQSGLISLIFKFCDDEQLPLLDLKDFKKVLHYITNDGKDKVQAVYGNISTVSCGTILRKVIELEQQGAEIFFGEPSFDVLDLCRKDKAGKGIVSILKISDLQDKPKLFSTFMLSLLAEIYATYPERGDLDKPELVVFIDEAHLIFEEATKTLTDQIETIIKLIRSKGIGIIFCTQNPSDIPASVLGQLGLKIQHALRAFTPNDRKMIKQTAENYPTSDFYKTDVLLTSLGIGEAAVTVLNEKGVPTPLAATLLKAPGSRMGTLTPAEIKDLISYSTLVHKYNQHIDRESAYEILSSKIKSTTSVPEERQQQVPAKEAEKKQGKSTLEQVMDSPLSRQIGRTVMQELTRGLLGILGVKSTRRR